MAAETAIIDLGGEKLPADAAVIRYDANEHISRPYEVDVEFAIAVEALNDFDVDDTLGSSMALRVLDDLGKQRVFHGVVDRAEYHGFTGNVHHFRVRLRPELAALAHRENCKIWQDTNIVDVMEEIFTEAGVTSFEFVLSHGHESRQYIVQYRESELNFIHRLMEDEGLFYFFRHTPEAHKMVIADDVAAFKPSDDAPEVQFAMAQGFSGQSLEIFDRRVATRTSVVTLKDYDFEKPQTNPEASQNAPSEAPLTSFHYPGGFIKGALGGLMATAKLRALRQDRDQASGESRAIGLRCGVPFSVAGAAQPWLDGDYVVVGLTTWGEQTRDSGEANEVCRNKFIAIPDGAQYMPERSAHRPRIRGVQTAVVTGASTESEGIHVDKYGRIKVRFHWDRIGQLDENSSCWLRVNQYATGGNMLLPRIGWEMAIAFMDGDPDRPFSMGRLYNKKKMAPAGLPAAKATGGLKSYSSPGGAGINELNLSDEGGSMGWTLNAQKDLNVVIRNDKKETIAVDSSHDIKTNANVTIGANETVHVVGDQTESTGSVRKNTVEGSQTIKVGGDETNNATHNMLETVTGDRSYEVGDTMTRISNTVMQKVTGNVSREVGAIHLIGSIASITDQVGGDMTEEVTALKAELIYGSSNETVGSDKNQTSIAAELHVLGGNYELEGEGTVTYMVGGVHYQKIDGDLSVKGTLVTLLGATGDFKAGGNLKLGGGPVVAKASKITADAKGINVKLGASLKLG